MLSKARPWRLRTWLLVATLAVALVALVALGSASPSLGQAPTGPEAGPLVPEQVEIEPAADDAAIAARLARILRATGWFEGIEVEVQDGVVFLDGTTTREAWQAWAASMAGNTVGVVAVVDRLEVQADDALDFAPALDELESLGQESLRVLPLVVVVVLILVATWLLSLVTLRVSRRLLRDRAHSRLLANLLAWLATAPVILVGLYVALRVAGLTQLALTVIGGTGLVGLIVGIAFRDIAENYLASILISVRNPFRAGDRIEVDGIVGIVQRVTTRGTILMTLDGNHQQIPNSTVYKSTITNYTANPSRRMDFAVGIGYDASVPEAQAAVSQVLEQHPVVLTEPEPLVLVEELGTSTVNLRAYFWFNGTQYEGLKLKSALIRLVKRALETRGISMPDEAREVIFPQGVPLLGAEALAGPGRSGAPPTEIRRRAEARDPDPMSTHAEGGLASEDAQLQAQARQARLPEAGEDLLDPDPSPR